ncbi:hypothetical protein FB595_107165 [Sphingobium sp. AEW010]|nr:hypothetical protein FB595_107165 [Sphingobium sp. AEW010]TWD24336.1 hypothetical protein FB596_1078 [Sphingobium sp. AEW013]
MSDHSPAVAPLLKKRSDSNIFNQQIILTLNDLHQSGHIIIYQQEVGTMIPYVGGVVGFHGQGFATDYRHPFGIRCSRNRGDGIGVC